MADTVAPEKRSRIMAAIRSKDTKPELTLRRLLHAMGFRYTLNVRRDGARPDLFFRKHDAAIFVHGCFWHGHEACGRHRLPKSNGDFWKGKFERNKARDIVDIANLRSAGHRVAVVWECALLRADAVVTAGRVARWLLSEEAMLEIPEDARSDVATRTIACEPP
jgi:DNA mismatch endonuclease (patch repair protein)